MHHLLVYGPRAPQYETLLRERGYTGKISICTTREEAEAVVGEAEILLGLRLPADLYPLMTRCRWVQSVNAGVEDLIAAPLLPGVVATRVEGLFGGYISEYIMGYMLAHTLHIRQAYSQQAESRWEHYYIGRLAGKRLGLAGTGTIGLEVARRAQALGMEVVGLSRSGAPTPHCAAVYPVTKLFEFCEGLDFLAVTLPLTAETRGLFGAEAFARLKPGAVVINSGRGALIQEEALLGALRSGHLGGAVLDVFPTEPLPAESPLWQEPKVTVTPHISGPSVPAEVADYFMANYRRYAQGEPLQGVIDRARGY